jgi:L-ascorbate metabolism protein UlaG (beta-lactamase superfamily)
MGPEEACRFAKALNPKVFVPMHWNIANETCLDPREIQMAARKFGILDRTRILNVGDQLIVSKSGPEERKST